MGNISQQAITKTNVSMTWHYNPDSKVHGAHLGPVGPRWAACTLLSGKGAILGRAITWTNADITKWTLRNEIKWNLIKIIFIWQNAFGKWQPLCSGCNVFIGVHLLAPGRFGSGIISCMCPVNERRHYNVTLTLIGWAHAQRIPEVHHYVVWFPEPTILLNAPLRGHCCVGPHCIWDKGLQWI